MTRLQFQKYVEPWFAVLFLIALGVLVSEIECIENTIGGMQLLWFALGVGGLFGLVSAAVFSYHHHELLSGLVGPLQRSVLFSVMMALTLGLMSVAGASYANRAYARGSHELKVTVTEKFRARGQAMRPRLVIQLDSGAEEHVRVDRPFWDRTMPGDEVHLTLCRGALGYDVVKDWSADARRSSSTCG